MKFKVGDRVKHFNDRRLGTVHQIKKGYHHPYVVKWDDTGEYSALTTGELVLIQPEVQDPIPGKFYRTRDGRKLLYIGKQIQGYYLYQSLGGDLHTYTRANLSGDENIVGEWQEEVVLPAVEIKQWAVVQLVDKRVEYGYCGGHVEEGFEDIKRGDILKCSSDKEYLKRHLKADEEIVELTGTLPERKV